MKQKVITIKVRDLVKGYSSSEENGVRGYDGKLDIRPPYQREFIYNEEKQRLVIETILEDCCLNLFQWSDNGDGTYEVLDGQQRTLSICKYINGDFSYNNLFFYNQPKDIQEKILDFEIIVNIVKGENSERLRWFEKINVAGEVLTKQELRNATYVGEWLSDAKLYFSKNNCAAFNKAKHLIKGDPIRQEYLELAIKWIAHSNSDDAIKDYMGKHQYDANADELKEYFCKVIDWVEATFDIRDANSTKYRKEMKGIDWGTLYEKYHNNTYNPQVLENKVAELMANEEVTNKKGIYEYVLSNEDEDVARELSNRKFSDRDKRTKYEQQKGICPICGEWHDIKEMDGDHIIPWWKGGTTTFDNLQMLCKKCNGKKSGS